MKTTSFIQIVEFMEGGIGNCVTTHEPGYYVQHSNLCIEIQRITKDEVRQFRSK